MNKFKSLVAFLMMLWVSPNVFAIGEYPDHHWQPVYTDFNMTAIFAVRIDGVMQTSPDLELGAFAGDSCRASFHLVLTPPPFNTGVYITEGYNIQGYRGETLTFRLYDHATESELEVMTAYTLPFVPNQNVGDAVDPQYIDFYTVSSSYYTLVTDKSQLVDGRKYLVATGFEGSAMAMGCHNRTDHVRYALEIDFANKKTYQTPAVVPADGYVYQFTLGSLNDNWFIYDSANAAYIATNQSGFMRLTSTPTEWNIVISPDGKAQVGSTVTDGDRYLSYDPDEEYYSCVDDASSYVYLFAQCDLVSGTMESLAVTDPVTMLVVESDDTLTVADLSTVHVSNLILEDGAQLVNTSEGVLATMQKEVGGYADIEVSDGWYTLASPMVAALVEEGSNLMFPEYDLYYLDETNLTQEEWRNYKNSANNGFTAFEEGRGYLYANGNTFTPIFKGALNHADIAFPMTFTEARRDDLKGFSLVGNPYPHNIYKGAGGAIDDSDLASGYYVLTDDGAWVAATYETAIAPCQGILVQTAVAKTLNIVKTNAVATGETNAKKNRGETPRSIAISLSNGVYGDAAYLFLNEGSNLNKIHHFNRDIPALSIFEDGNSYAIAHLDENAESVDLQLDNELPGRFTMKVEAKGWDKGYLHLIDHVTGADVDLLRTPEYRFDASGREYASRFKLVFQGEANPDEAFAFFDGSEWIVNDYEGATLQVVDMLGRVVMSGEAKPRFSTAGWSSGVYLFRLVSGDHERSQKVVVE